MATIAETFLDDFDDSEEDEQTPQQQSLLNDLDDLDSDDDDDDDAVDIDAMEDVVVGEEADKSNQHIACAVEKVSSLLHSSRMQDHLKKIAEMQAMNRSDAFQGVTQHDEEYQLMVASNELAVEIDAEILALHKYVRDLYAPKFPELEQLVSSAVNYATVIQRLQNLTDLTGVKLDDLLPNRIILTITMSATTTTGRALPQADLDKVLLGAETLLGLFGAKQHILAYVASRMNLMAPNLSALIGTDLAAKLVGLAGGLERIMAIPACNLQVMGQSKANAAGLNVHTTGQHQGILVGCDLVRECPQQWQTKALRQVANKAILCARTDLFQTQSHNAVGRKFHDDVQKKIDKWCEPPPKAAKKALMAPGKLKGRKRRGGKRYRAMKEKWKVTETLRMANRIGFNVQEDEVLDFDETVGMGLLGKSGLGGKLRVQKSNNQKLSKMKRVQDKLNNPRFKRKMARKKQQKQANISGFATVSYSVVDGLELTNPDNLKKQKTAADNETSGTATYFAKSGGFSVLPQRQ